MKEEILSEEHWKFNKLIIKYVTIITKPIIADTPRPLEYKVREEISKLLILGKLTNRRWRIIGIIILSSSHSPSVIRPSKAMKMTLHKSREV